LEYAGLKAKLVDEKEITLAKIRETVIKIRNEKLPDWHKIGTAGSFFKNPIITTNQYEQLKKQYPEIPGFAEKNKKMKVSLAWILDRICNLKGYKEGQAGLYEKQPLVVVNLGQASAKDVLCISAAVKKIVKEKTGITVEEEVEIC
jgi:UDP-N-acetylmuramate dehydrogenase